MHGTQKQLFTLAKKLTSLTFGDVNYHSRADLSIFRSKLILLSYAVVEAHSLCAVKNNEFGFELKKLLSQIKSFLAKNPYKIKSLQMHFYWLQVRSFPLVIFLRRVRENPNGFDLDQIAPNIIEGKFKEKDLIRIRKNPPITE